MKVTNMIVKSLSVTVAASILMLASCSKNNELNSADVENVSSELLSEACVAEASEMSIVIFSNVRNSLLGSTLPSIPDLSSIDSLLTGALISISGTGGMNNPQGAISIDFKTGTTDHHGILRKGVVKINYTSRRWAPESSYSISFSGYSRNNVKIDDGTNYIIKNLSADSLAKTRDFYHVLTGCQLIFPDWKSDQNTFLRNAKFVSTINFVSKTTTVSVNDTTAISGKTRYGADFVTTIKTALIYKSQCSGSKVYLPSDGTKTITVVGSSIYAVDYSSTLTCGQTVGVKAGDKSATITVNSDGN